MSAQATIGNVRPAVASFTKIPLIDLAPLQDGTERSRQKVAAEICDACERVGFLYVRNHGVPEQTGREIFSASAEFFALPPAEKMMLRLGSQTSFRGFLPSGVDGGTSAGNRKECFQILSETPPTNREGRAIELCKPNLWPRSLPRFRIALLSYYWEMEQLAAQLLRLFAIGLGVAEDTFVRHFREPVGLLRLLNYPTQQSNDRAIGSQPHTDGSALTILAQDDAGGLEALNDVGDWTKVTPLPGTFVINLGETMKLWSDGRLAATPHRVINTSGRNRTSIAYFANPDFHTVIQPVITATKRAREVELVGHLDPSRTMTTGEIVLNNWYKLWG
jgi:isopenicillin N synthase-like dioxygenase